VGIRGISYSGIGSEKILTGSVTVGGSVTPPAKTNQTFTALPKTVKAGKSVTIAALTGSKVAVKVVVTGTGCKVAAVKKSGKTTGHKVTVGKKNVTCTVTVTAPGTSALNAFKAVYKVKAN
jgi:hypothetical protein